MVYGTEILYKGSGFNSGWGEGGLTAHGSRLTAHGFRRLGGGGCGGERASLFVALVLLCFMQQRLQSKNTGPHSNFRSGGRPVPQLTSGRSPSSRGKIILFLFVSVSR